MWDRLEPRTKLVATEEVASQLKSSNREVAEKKFAKNLIAGGPATNLLFPKKGNFDDFDDLRNFGALRNKMLRKQYEIDIPIPKAAQLVPNDLTIEKGTALALCWARKWHPMTVLKENPDGSLHLRWDERPPAFDCDMIRDQLIIQDKVLRKLQSKQESAEGDLTQTLRTWTDITGKHKVDARFLKRTEDELTIKTDAGREITMPIEKLSESDRDLLPAWQDDSDNPFK